MHIAHALVEMRETGFTEVSEPVGLMRQYQSECTVSVDGVPLAVVHGYRDLQGGSAIA